MKVKHNASTFVHKDNPKWNVMMNQFLGKEISGTWRFIFGAPMPNNYRAWLRPVVVV